jgi:hypothetical protein
MHQMLRHVSAGIVFLSLGSSSFAGVAITLVPTTPYPVGGYEPGQQINIDILAQLTAGTPSTPGGTSINVRTMQFDLSDSDAALGITPVLHHISSEVIPGGVPFWDFNHQSICASDEADCGTNYLIDGALMDDDLVKITYVGLTTYGPPGMLRLTQAPRRVGELQVTMPTDPGTYVLDVLNANETDPSQGAEVNWGFGYVADPTDPTSPLRASTGGITGGRICLGICIPEPGMLVLLGLGGLIMGKRRGLYL